MVVEVDGFVGREEGVKLGVGEGVGVQSLGLEDHQVRDVDDADTEGGAFAAEHGGRHDDFEGHFGSNSTQDNVWVEAIVRGGEFPDRRPSLAVFVGFFDGKEDGLGLLGADHEVYIVLRTKAVGNG